MPLTAIQDKTYLAGTSTAIQDKIYLAGTSTVIKAAAKQKSVKRIVITSSIAAIMTSKDMYPKEGEVYDDKTFNTHDTVETSAYQASKVSI